MTTLTNSHLAKRLSLLPIVAAAIVGLGLIFVVGHVQAHGLHEVAHDVRHATGFPCH